MMSTTISISNLTTGYSTSRKGVVTVTENLTADLHSGELTCLLGPNGAGKSTLLRTLCGFQPPLGGEIEIEGKPLSAYSDAQLARMVSVVLTERIMVSQMTVRRLVELGRSPYTGFWGRLSLADNRIVEASMEQIGISRFRNRDIATLSDGEKQKALIAKALAQQTPIIFLDEPAAFLDYPSKVEIMQLLRELARVQQKTVFLSTHDLELALQIADRVWLVDKNRPVRIGVPEDLALTGHLGSFFGRSGVDFDAAEGIFRIEHPVRKSVSLVSGDTPQAQMRASVLTRALRRSGIAAAGGSPEVRVSDIGWSVGDRECSSIEEVLRVLTDC